MGGRFRMAAAPQEDGPSEPKGSFSASEAGARLQVPAAFSLDSGCQDRLRWVSVLSALARPDEVGESLAPPIPCCGRFLIFLWRPSSRERTLWKEQTVK